MPIAIVIKFVQKGHSGAEGMFLWKQKLEYIIYGEPPVRISDKDLIFVHVFGKTMNVKNIESKSVWVS